MNSDKQCTTNLCTCGYGKPARGKLCPVHGETGCEDADLSLKILDSSINKENQGRELTDAELMQRFQILCELSPECSLLPTEGEDNCSNLNMVDGVHTMGIGFDGTKDFSLASKRATVGQTLKNVGTRLTCSPRKCP